VVALIASCAMAEVEPQANAQAGPAAYRSPFDVAFSPDGRDLATSDRTGGTLAVIDVHLGKVIREVWLGGEPTGVVWSSNGRGLYVAEHVSGTVAEIDRSGRVLRRFHTRQGPVGLALAPRRGLLLIANSASHTVSAVNPANGRELACVRVSREPYFLAVTPDERLAVVGNRLPSGDSSDPRISAAITLIDLENKFEPAEIRLPPNSTNVYGIATSPDGKWAYVAHNVGRTALATTLIEYGWINANAVSIVDLSYKRFFATILIDHRERGAANPWGIALSDNGETAWVALSGTHQLLKLDLNRLHRSVQEQMPLVTAYQKSLGLEQEDTMAIASAVYSDTAGIYGDDPTSVELMVTDLPAAYAQGVYLKDIAARIDLPGNGPRGLAVSPDGTKLAATVYYSGHIVLIDTKKGDAVKVVPLGEQLPASQPRRGEMIFHDATYCYQQWLSCSTCHPDGRADGLNWDLLNDGIGNAKNTSSLVLSHRTPPVMLRGVRSNVDSAISAGFEFALFRPAKSEDLQAVQAYITSLRPAISPHGKVGSLSVKAKTGKQIFESSQVGCSRCHPAPLSTNLQMYDVGTGIEADRDNTSFDTPTLVEIWRTAPYLHHGKATTLREIFTKFNKKDRHGKTLRLSNAELDALIEYLESI
jgi:DNA-binding beta-propeller fold protein YncE